ncbi:MAG: hypothetical protein IPM18_05070 [Phycisphaerales bacterium]|nr:hypothetical protein [Phycisphaerales bacterium]
MSIFRNRRLLAALVCVSTGVVFQFTPACTQFAVPVGVQAFNFCSVLNCTGGSFFNLCSPVPILADCPNIVVPE